VATMHPHESTSAISSPTRRSTLPLLPSHGMQSFSCLFFKEKQMLLKLLSHFKDKSGKYAIQGFPHKLGLLLHGPPGTVSCPLLLPV
jgi:hypothetical protein